MKPHAIDDTPALFERRRWRWGLFVGGWIVLSFLVVAPIFVSVVAQGEPIPWSKMVSEVSNWYLWILVFPLIWWVTQRFPFRRRHWRRWLLINLALGVLISSFYGLLTLVKSQLITDLSTGQASFHLLRLLPRYLLSGIEYFFLVYLAIIAVIHAVQYGRLNREDELKSSRLETQLAVAQLNVLKMQLHPHFLFNTLNAISALMHHDVDAADRMITKLSDLLRLSWDGDDRPQVSLQEELAFLDRYVGIEMIRFQDRLKVSIDIESDCLDALVPKLVLQPLVENAIRHGIAMRSAAGRVQVRGRQVGGRLRLVVSDDGPGMPHGPDGLREGVGLANTRARLVQLYARDHRFTLRNGRVGGFEVVIEIPFEQTQRLPSTRPSRQRRAPRAATVAHTASAS